MLDTAKRVAWTFVQAFLGALLVLAPGVFLAPNLKEARAVGIAALIAAVAAGWSAVKNVIVPPSSAVR